MRPPTYIATASGFLDRVKLGHTTEDVGLDFKAKYPGSSSAGDEIRKDVAAMANTWGGCVLVGIGEASGASGLKVAKAVVDIDAEQTRNTVLDCIAVKMYPIPEVHVSPIHLANSAGGTSTLLAINVLPLLDGVCSCVESDDRLVHYYRDDYGVKRFRADEVHLRMNNQARRLQVIIHNLGLMSKMLHVATRVDRLRPEWDTERAERVLRTKNPINAMHAPTIREPHSLPWLQLKEVTTTHLVVTLDNSPFSLPFSLVRDIWAAPNGEGYIAAGCPLTYDSVNRRVILELRD